LKVHSDYILHYPSGSNYPGKEEANPYIFYPPNEIRRLIETEKSCEELKKMKSALKQWERLYVYPGYPWRIARILRNIAQKLAEVKHPSQNIDYYQDSEVPEGYEGILDSLRTHYDNYDMALFDYSRQGERPLRDIDTGYGDFLSPSQGVYEMKTVSPRGDGADPEGLEVPFPPTGGTLDMI